MIILAIALMAAQASEPARPSVTGDFASPEAVVQALYESNSGGPGVAKDWSRFRALFLPSARIVAVLRDPAGAQRTSDQSVDEYIAVAGPRLEKRAFREWQVGHRTLRYGAVVQVWSAYEARHGVPPQETVIRGINSIQVVQANGRWMIAHLLWTNDQAAGPVPPEYLQDR